MSLQDPQPPVAWRYAGDQLKRWRTKAGVSREELGTASNYAPDTIKSMEQGVRMPTPKLLDAADDLLRAEGLLSAAKQYLRRERFPVRAHDYMLHEREAISLWWYELALVPGLLQTEDYARALIGNHCPPFDDETVEERVTARIERQSIFARKPPVVFSFVLFEAVLRTPVGGLEVHRRQLLHLLEMGRLRHVSLQVMPFDRAIPAALMGQMVLMETRDHDRLAYAEGQPATELTPDPDVVSSLTERHSMIRMQALSVEESACSIERIVGEL
ncbi:helix-turn-helix domain-containing protein [Streptomyces sp. NPDC126933]|uniref:helix-turn-helix domain-containing protein n=1 Tax=unclassified Streptomyces TaxID=2593676 RepID=UPI0036557BC7